MFLFGCTRKYECDVGTINPETREFHSIGGAEGTLSSSTGDFLYTREEAEETCEASYNDSRSTGSKSDSSSIAAFQCTCERAN